MKLLLIILAINLTVAALVSALFFIWMAAREGKPLKLAKNVKQPQTVSAQRKKLFATAFIQVSLVAANTYFIASLYWTGIAVASFMISYMWTINVRRISIGGKTDRLIYSAGAMAGGITGVYVSMLVM